MSSEMSTNAGGAGGSVPADDSTALINLKVKSQDGQEVFYSIKKGTRMGKLINAYCNRTGKNPDHVVFLFDGRRISPEQTPRDLQLKEDDVIDAMLHQTGAGESHGQ